MNRGVSRAYLQLDKVGDFVEIPCKGLEYVRASAEGTFGTGRIQFYGSCDYENKSQYFQLDGGSEMSAAGISSQKDVRGVAWVRVQVTTAGSAGAYLLVSLYGYGSVDIGGMCNG